MCPTVAASNDELGAEIVSPKSPSRLPSRDVARLLLPPTVAARSHGPGGPGCPPPAPARPAKCSCWRRHSVPHDCTHRAITMSCTLARILRRAAQPAGGLRWPRQAACPRGAGLVWAGCLSVTLPLFWRKNARILPRKNHLKQTLGASFGSD